MAGTAVTLWGLTGDACRVDLGQYKALQIVPHANLPGLASFFLIPQHVLLVVVQEVLQSQLGDRPRPAGGIPQTRRLDRWEHPVVNQFFAKLIGSDFVGWFEVKVNVIFKKADVRNSGNGAAKAIAYLRAFWQVIFYGGVGNGFAVADGH
jgi:hypothetical protein